MVSLACSFANNELCTCSLDVCLVSADLSYDYLEYGKDFVQLLDLLL